MEDDCIQKNSSDYRDGYDLKAILENFGNLLNLILRNSLNYEVSNMLLNDISAPTLELTFYFGPFKIGCVI